ncbi:LysR family transcriptional regulator [Pseudohalocynthiibacter sp. F2068]|jgi:DNA-binding transcriptional LysR family regulator|uniref:LysR family transcriptional regulator n=1 Tax=Pseudohalocynthiibacter sp. F2068 TaxID=2926418 RepID=UPI001FF2C17C|nr:LysR family transcriptional regulator [Pseudohalocynthiibacter sp. F2068]MCK0102380.1 LysR family transcriptional regulator [Pseudohalocynthiibacter sp. F2068]
MNWQAVSFDWNHVRAFLATAEEGSLSAAARVLAQTQPTLGRQVAALEEKLGVVLFERVGRSLSLTQSGLELLEHVRAMGDAASRISLTASGQSQTIEGNVRLTASDAMSAYFLPPVLKKLRQVAPGLTVEIVASNTVRDLQQREADIAIRHIRPEQPDLIAKLVRETTAHLYASTKFLDEQGRPSSADDLKNVVFIGFETSDRLISGLNELGLSLTNENFKLVSNSGVATWEMVKHGLGIGVMVREVAEMTPDIELVLPDLVPIPVPIWLVTHRELHTSRRIRLVFDLLADAFRN